MSNNKTIVSTVISALVFASMSVAIASTSNDLLRMDLKKSAEQDSIDVTFYTTGNPIDSIVTRKSGNSYVVLLPNVAGTQSVVPSLGAIKDLVTDVSVKNVDDGIGGYTKVTFSSTKPIKIKTSTKQTAPLTQAQQDYKMLIAKNNVSANNNSVKPVNNTSKGTTPNQKQSSSPKPASTTVKSAPTVVKPVSTAKPSAQSVQNPQSTVKSEQAKTVKTNSVSNTNKIIDKQKESINNSQDKIVKEDNTQRNNKLTDNKDSNITPVVPTGDTVAKNNVESKFDTETSKKSNKIGIKQRVSNKLKNSRYNNPIFPIAGAFSIIALFLFIGLSKILSGGSENQRNRLKEYLDQTAVTNEKQDEELQSIMNDDSSNWQEKYKQYSKIKEQRKHPSRLSKVSYVKDMSSSKGMMVSDAQLAKDKMSETISKMEHAFAQTPSNIPSDDDFNRFYSEDDVISNTMQEVKLKSFAKDNLSQSNRNLVSFDELAQRKKLLKEGKFVGMNNSSVTMSRRKSKSSGLNFANIVRGTDSYEDFAPTNDEIKEEYVSSTLNEYMNLVENEKKPALSNNYSNVKNNKPVVQTPSGSVTTNPMKSQKKEMLQKSESVSVNGLKVKYNHNIDNDKSIYMVDLEGKTNIIGKIKDEVFVLKQFEKIINKPMQVRADYDNTYIVRVGEFKCLVKVSDNKMGTLLEI